MGSVSLIVVGAGSRGAIYADYHLEPVGYWHQEIPGRGCPATKVTDAYTGRSATDEDAA
jgi:hypothetical protein